MKLKPEILETIRTAHTIAVVGLSSNPARPSYGVARYLQSQGYRIIPVNPGERTVLGETAFPSLDAIPDTLRPVDIVDVFRRSQFVPDIVEQAIGLGARLLWLQEGVSHAGAEARAHQAGMQVVSDACLLKAHGRFVRPEAVPQS
ncbi:MAG: CoA-binding protein [Acidobacteria bacterium]|nr:MAG: CoA-binding protein [Acidobacteriota bacterium]